MPISSETYFTLSPYFANSSEEDRDALYAIFDRLPQNIRSFLTATFTAERIADIAETYRLSMEQAELVSRVVREIATGNLFLQDVPETIARLLVTDIPSAKKITADVIHQLFGGILNDLKQIQQEHFADRLGQGAAPMPNYSTDIDTQTESPAQMEEKMASRPARNNPVQNVNENNIINLRERG